MYSDNLSQKKFIKGAVSIVVALFLFMIALGGFYTVDQGEQAYACYESNIFR